MLLHISRSRKKNCLCIGRWSVIQLWSSGGLIAWSVRPGGCLVVLEAGSDLVSVDKSAAKQDEARDEDAGAEQCDEAGQEPGSRAVLSSLDPGATSLLSLLPSPAVNYPVTQQVPPHTGPGHALTARSPPDVGGVTTPPDRSHHQPQTSPGLGVASLSQPQPDIHLMVLGLQIFPGGQRAVTRAL